MIFPQPLKIPDFRPTNEGNWILKFKDGRTRDLFLIKVSHDPFGNILHFFDACYREYLSMPQEKFEQIIKRRG